MRQHFQDCDKQKQKMKKLMIINIKSKKKDTIIEFLPSSSLVSGFSGSPLSFVDVTPIVRTQKERLTKK
jgi:hypothetical protein